MQGIELDNLIEELRRAVVIGSEYDLERVFAEIRRLRRDPPPILVPAGFDMRPGALNKVYR